MCLSCGCCLPNDDHGNMANITYTKLLKAMVAGKVTSPAQTIANMMTCYEQMQSSGDADPSDNDDDDSYQPPYGNIDADKGDGPGTVPNDPNYLKNNTQYITRPGGM
jgi:hypothetical protein